MPVNESTFSFNVVTLTTEPDLGRVPLVSVEYTVVLQTDPGNVTGLDIVNVVTTEESGSAAVSVTVPAGWSVKTVTAKGNKSGYSQGTGVLDPEAGVVRIVMFVSSTSGDGHDLGDE